ncbi:hypothetical protein ACM55G_14715 [Flavobacterium sp. LB3P122]|uniref:hypothetical protein n=1 Tax=Flavobacterium algoriphilum TaxID=3398738 RepID=UPI003A8B5F15
MAEENSTEEIIKGTKSFLNQLTTLGHGINAIQNCNIDGYGPGQESFNQLQSDFNKLDFSLNFEESELKKRINKDKKEVAELEVKHAELTSIFGEEKEVSKGSLAYHLVFNLESEIKDLIKKRDGLLNEVKQAKINSDIDLSEWNKKVNESIKLAQEKIEFSEKMVSKRVRIINQFSDFLAETNSNMILYSRITVIMVSFIMLTIALSVPDLLASFKSYNTFITSLGAKATSWQILNFAFGILIVKLPWALCLSAVFTGFYALIKGLLTTYEKINQDKRNISAIYAVSGNIAESLNAYGFAIADHDNEDDETGEVFTEIRILNKELNQKKESLKWNQIMNYFERMQHHKEEIVVKEDESKLKLVTDLLKTAMERIPKTQ